MAQLALAWVLRQPNVASALIGASRPEQVVQNAKASGYVLERRRAPANRRRSGVIARYPGRGSLRQQVIFHINNKFTAAWVSVCANGRLLRQCSVQGKSPMLQQRFRLREYPVVVPDLLFAQCDLSEQHLPYCMQPVRLRPGYRELLSILDDTPLPMIYYASADSVRRCPSPVWRGIEAVITGLT